MELFSKHREVPLLIIVLVFQLCFSFNLEPRIPIIKIGPIESHFGYTVAQHRIRNNYIDDSYTNNSWMLVGAPKGENLQPNTNKSGALFKCPISPSETDCVQVMTDGIKNSNGIYTRTAEGDILGPAEDEIKDDQWMGVTVKSQGEGGDILVCAHRYQNKGVDGMNFQWGYGLCYRLDDEFQFEKVYQPCVGRPVERAQEQFGYCQTGTSGVILEDEVVLGLPGTYNWRGTIHTKNTSRDEMNRDKTDYFGVFTEAESPVDKYSYLGYSVAAGRFNGNKMSYVAGAPRSQGTGQVVFFSRDKLYTTQYMNYDLILDGEMFASSFGFEVLAMDINNDKHDDLVVSAPFYFKKHSSGAVYIYMNDGNGITTETPYTKLVGPAGESRFGFSMTSLGDLNLDGYNDLAVGAPYDGNGAIYIYLGSKDGIIEKPVQVIRAEDLPGVHYDAFGYALSGGLDLDGNNYPDLLTSSFCSDRVILLRARPIVSIKTDVDASKMKNIDTNIRGCPNDRSSPLTCVSFKTCFTVINEAGKLTRLEVKYNISEILYEDQPVHRILFFRDGTDSSTRDRTINLRKLDMNNQRCFDEIVYLRSDIRDKLRPIKFKLAYEIIQEEPRPVSPKSLHLPNIDDYPILNQDEAISEFNATFAKDCGDDDKCDSDLIVFAELDLDRHENEDYYMYELGVKPFFTVAVVVTNEGEPAYSANLFIEHDVAIDLSNKESQTGNYQCASVENGLVKCNLDKPFLNTTGNLSLVFKPSGLPFKGRFIHLRIWAESSSEEVNPENNQVEFSLEVKRRAEVSITGAAEPEQVFYSGDIIGESAMEKLSDIGTKVVHKYLIDNRGPWKVDEMTVEIQWPYQVENNREKGKWLLYLTQKPIVDGDGYCDMQARYLNELNLDEERPKFVSGEVDSGRFRGYTTHPPPSVTTTKVRKVTYKKTYSEKKTITKESRVSSSSSSKSSFDEHEESESHSRNNNRMSRKVFSSSGKNRVNHRPDQYEDNTEDYGNYDNFDFYGNTEDKKSMMTSESQRLQAVDNLIPITEGGLSFLNGYDLRRRLVWSSRGDGSFDREYRQRIFTAANGDRINLEENNRLLHNLMSDIVDFRIITDELDSWVNGYDSGSTIIWSSRAAPNLDDGGRKTYTKKEYSYSESTKNGKGRSKWSSSVTDEDGTRSRSGSSIITGDEDHPHNRDFGKFDSFGSNSDLPESSKNSESRRTFTSSSSSSSSSTHDGRFNWDDEDKSSSGGRWSGSGGFKRSHEPQEGKYRPNESDYSEEHPPSQDSNLHKNTYSRAMVDPQTGRMHVVTQKVFSRKSGDQWEEVVHGPFNDLEWADPNEEGPTLKRTKRERAFVIKPQAITDANTGKTMQIISFTCDGDVPTAKCFTITCKIKNLGPEQSASIRIVSRLWNSTLVEDYPRVSYVSIKSKGRIILAPEIVRDQDTSDDVDYAETLAYSNLLEQLTPEEVPIWVIIVSVLAGLLLLAIFAVILYKLGFFERKRPDPTLSGNLDRDINGYN